MLQNSHLLREMLQNALQTTPKTTQITGSIFWV